MFVCSYVQALSLNKDETKCNENTIVFYAISANNVDEAYKLAA